MPILIFMGWKDKILNYIYNFLSSDRTCSKCNHMTEEKSILSILVSPSGMAERVRMIRRCTLDKSTIPENEESTKNCRYFKRKYGHAPITQKIYNFETWAKLQWKLHYK